MPSAQAVQTQLLASSQADLNYCGKRAIASGLPGQEAIRGVPWPDPALASS